VLVISQVAGLTLGVTATAAAGAGPPAASRIVYGVLAGLVGIVGLVAFYRGLATAAMGVVAPIAATAVVVPLVVGLARGERPSVLQDAGIALAIVGVVGVSREPAGTGPRRLAGGVGFALVAAACFGFALVGLSAAAKGGALWAGLSLRIGGTVPVCLVALLAGPRGGARIARRGWAWLVLVGVTDATASILYGAATTRGLLSVVAVVASLYPVLVVLLARGLLDERLATAQLGGAAAALAGIALISAG
jgi:drug/metabolite transporter (DMT)-like permease